MSKLYQETIFGRLPSSWNVVKFKDILKLVNEKSTDNSIIMYSITNEGIFPREEKFNKQLANKNSKFKVIHKNNLIFGMSREILNWGIMGEEVGGVSSAYTVYQVDSSINTRYLGYFIHNWEKYFKDIIKPASREGQGIEKDILMTKIMYVPPEKDLNKMFKIIDSINEKIKINTHINNNLEILSKTIFSQYFELFEYPDQEEKPYKSNKGKFKDSSIGPIPQNWDLKTIDELAIVKGRIGWRGYRSTDLVDEGPWVIGGKEINSNNVNLTGAKHITRSKYDESPEIKLEDHDILLAKTGTIGPVAMYYKEYGEATINPNTCIIRVTENYSSLLLTFLKSERAQYYLKEYSTSSVQPAINQTNIKKLTIPLPNDINQLKQYAEIFSKINESQKHLNLEIDYLTKLRDTLLPKLMSGEIDVSDINFDLD